MKNLIKILCLSLIGCNSEDNSNLKLVENINIFVDYDKLSSNYNFSDSSTIFNPPINWTRSSKDAIEAFNKKLNDNDNVIDINVEDSFISDDGSFVLISRINSNESNFNYIPKDYLELMKEQFSVDSIIHYTFNVNNILVRQYLITLENIMIFKIFIENNNNFELDFFLSKELYNNQIKSIESSIGSIKRRK